MEEIKKDAIVNLAENKLIIDERAKMFVERFLNYILLSFIIVALGFASFFTFNIDGEITRLVIVNIIILTLANIASLSLFIPQGKGYESKYNSSFKQNANEWSNLSYLIQTDYSRKFIKFCKETTEEKRIDKLENILKSALMTLKEFEKEIAPLSDEKFKLFLEKKDQYGRNEFTKKQKKLLKKARGKIKVVPIDPTIILLGATTNSKFDVGKVEKLSADQKIFAKKVFNTIVYSIIIAMVGIMPTPNDLWLSIALFVLRVTTIFSSAVAGFYAGIKAIKERNELIKRNIFFLKLFIKETEIINKN